MKKNVNTFLNAKGKRKISMLTAYDYSMAKIIDEAGVDSILVGDSLGNVMLGYDTTLAVTVDDMIHHAKAVVRGAKEAMVIVDLPFMSYQTNAYDALVNAGRIMKESGASGVKIEGGIEIYEQVKSIVDAGIPVCGHLGLTPQSVNAFGGYKVQANTKEKAAKLISDAKALQDAGVFAVVLECVPGEIAKLVTEALVIPTIGIGAGHNCDGQVLVSHDMFGMFNDYTPKFVKKYANGYEILSDAVKSYITEINDGSFPLEEHEFKMKKETIDKLY